MGRSSDGYRIGPYVLGDALGQGSSGTVYRAAESGTGRDVAVKVVGEPLRSNPAFVSRFQQEASAVARLQHPFILPVYETGIDHGTPYVVMAYPGGQSLAGLIASHDGGLSIEDVVRIISQVASAVDFAHAEGVVHRDIKPGNILLDKQGNAFLADFGVAVLPDGGDLLYTEPPGTPPYIAPEVLSGGLAVPASDIYALAVVLFEMLTGFRPDELPQSRRRTGSSQTPFTLHPWRPELPPGVQVVLDQALAPDPSARTSTAMALASALIAASGQSPLIVDDRAPDLSLSLPLMDTTFADLTDSTQPGAPDKAPGLPPRAASYEAWSDVSFSTARKTEPATRQSPGQDTKTAGAKPVPVSDIPTRINLSIAGLMKRRAERSTADRALSFIVFSSLTLVLLVMFFLLVMSMP